MDDGGFAGPRNAARAEQRSASASRRPIRLVLASSMVASTYRIPSKIVSHRSRNGASSPSNKETWKEPGDRGRCPSCFCR